MVSQSIVDAIAELVRYCAPIVAIFGFVRYSLKLIYDVINGGKLR